MRSESAGPAWAGLPRTVTVGGSQWAIRTDFRDILYLLEVLGEPAYEPDERAAIALRVLYPQWRDMDPALYREALEAGAAFIDGGLPAAGTGEKAPRLMDWAQDGPLVVPAVNRALGFEVRAAEYLHWWTFLGAYMEIGESLFSTVLGLRRKRAKGKKLEDWEREFYRENRELVDLKKRRGPEDDARRAALKELFV